MTLLLKANDLAEPSRAAAKSGNPVEKAEDRLLVGAGDNRPRWRPGERLHHLFERQVDRLAAEGKAGQLAVDAGEAQWRYADLDAYANRMARWMAAAGVKSGDVVGLLFDKGVHGYAAMLAASKLQAVYVPLDPAFPGERIAFIASDAGLTGILTVEALARGLADVDVTVLSVDAEAARIAEFDDSRLSVPGEGFPADARSYIIYTSGSTGQPKGVPIDHSAICNFVQVAAEVYGYHETDRVYQGLTLAFDFAVEEIWVSLAVGATLVPNTTGGPLLGEDLADFLRQRRVTVMCCVPTLLATLDDELPALRLLLVSGEACPQDLIRRWAVGGRIMLNAYGPTETTVTATLARLEPGKPVTIGRPLPTYTAMILAPGERRLMPEGEEGEIGIGGTGVACGYLNRPEQTARAFIDDFIGIANNTSGRIYRTGDLGRINADGEIEYLGRIDRQVKIRGYRIELSEIESAIMRQDGVAQAAVEVFEPAPGVRMLAAWYTLKPGVDEWREDVLRAAVASALPSYMRPACWQRLERMPMMASDKVDRNALPAPDFRPGRQGEAGVAPRNATETLLVEALAGVLGLETFSIDDDFFTGLGASSLIMARFCAAVRKAMPGVDLSMRDVYTRPNVRELARWLDEQPRREKSAATSTRPAHLPRRRNYYLCGAAQLATWLAITGLSVAMVLWAVSWLAEADGPVQRYGRAVALSAVVLLGWSALAIAAKWTLIGRWKATRIPLWSPAYFRFWLARSLILHNPMVWFRGYPLYNLYLRLLGAKIGRNVVIECRHPLLCSDLIEIGDHAILKNDSQLLGYKARDNHICIGAVKIGRHVTVGEGSVVDIDTVIGDHGQLGHASCLLEGQHIEPGGRYHGNPAEPTTTRFEFPHRFPIPRWRPAVFSLVQIGGPLLVWPALLCLVWWLAVETEWLRAAADSRHWALQSLLLSGGIFLGGLAYGVARQTLWPRWLNRLLQPGKIYPYYGIHYWIFRTLQRASNSPAFHLLFGDSAFIVHYMKMVGYRMPEVVQTGSNFGLEHRHDNPLLCQFGAGTMISDGFSMLNVQESATAFQLAENRVGRDCFIGNNVYFPVGARVGANCLVATKAMPPVDGPLRENTGLLGSPPFEIPRGCGQRSRVESVDRAEGLRRKTRHNLATIALYLGAGFLYLFLMVLAFMALAPAYATMNWFDWELVIVSMTLFSVAWFAVVERLGFGFGRMRPVEVSIYDREYWRVERVWKLSETFLRKIWLGTPFRAIVNRLLGIRQGRMVFDDGLYVSEKTLVEIGDYANFNADSVLQSHSLEDGVYKSGRIRVGSHCNLEARAFIHYDVVMEDNVTVRADAFVMKGEHLAAGADWRGNPASGRH